MLSQGDYSWLWGKGVLSPGRHSWRGLWLLGGSSWSGSASALLGECHRGGCEAHQEAAKWGWACLLAWGCQGSMVGPRRTGPLSGAQPGPASLSLLPRFCSVSVSVSLWVYGPGPKCPPWGSSSGWLWLYLGWPLGSGAWGPPERRRDPRLPQVQGGHPETGKDPRLGGLASQAHLGYSPRRMDPAEEVSGARACLPRGDQVAYA